MLKNEGYIRGYAAVEHKDGRSELEIELKYFDGAPVIREIRAYRSRVVGSTLLSRPCRASTTAWV